MFTKRNGILIKITYNLLCKRYYKRELRRILWLIYYLYYKTNYPEKCKNSITWRWRWTSAHCCDSATKTDYVSPIVLGNEDNIKSLASKHALDLTQIEIIDPATSELKDELVDAFVERRKGKATKEQAVELLDNVNYFGTMLVYTGKAEGLVSGAAHSTGDTVRPALQIIKTKPGVSRTSGIFFMIKGDEQYILGIVLLIQN